MGNEKLTEFVTVLLFAVLIGVGAMLCISYLAGTALTVALIGLLIAAVTVWQFLRRRFRQGT